MFAAIGILSGIIGLASLYPYVRDIFKGTTKPERATWFIWIVLAAIAFFSQFAKGATHSLWLPGSQALGILLIFILSIKYGVGGFTRRDAIALIAAGFGLFLWFITEEAALALFIVIIIDAIGGWLTIVKTYYAPETETRITWIWGIVSGLLAAVAVGSFNAILLVYPIYIAFLCSAVVATIYLGKRRQRILEI